MFKFADTTVSRKSQRRRYRLRRLFAATVTALLFGLSGGLVAFNVGGETQTIESSPTATSAREDRLLANRSVRGDQNGAAEEQTGVAQPEVAEPLNVLVLGVDKRPEGEEAEAMGVRADTIIVARLTPDTGKVSLLSIPRDLFLEIAPGEEDRVNTAYAEGGVDRTRAVVENYTGIEIDHYATIDFAGFEDLVEAMGGVEVEVEDGYYPPGWEINACETQTLDGRQALLYARYRGTAGGDLDRIRRQQAVIDAMKDEAVGWDSVVRIPAMAKVVLDNTDSDVGLSEALPLAKIAVGEVRKSSGRISAYRLEGEPTTLEDGRQVLTPRDEENRQVVADFISAQPAVKAGGDEKSASGESEKDSGTCSVS